MKASENNLDRFLAQTDTQFVIPVYQRNYDWTTSECKQLLDDIFEIAINDEILAHFIGSIVYIKDSVYTSNDIQELSIIDGQQRLTTFTLVYLVILNLVRKSDDNRLVDKINKKYLINEFASDEEKLKLRPTENNDKALKFLLSNGKVSEYREFSRIIENYKYISSRINIENYDTFLTGLNKIMFVEIALERSKDDPQRIFESLNSTGLDLSQADLIRNYILMDLKQQQQKRVYENYWELIEESAKDHANNSSKVSDFIRDYITLKTKKIPNKNKVYQEFKARFPRTENIQILEGSLKELNQYVKNYQKLLNPDLESDLSIRRELEYIKKIEINVAYPFLMQVYDDYSVGVIDKNIFKKILLLIQSFVWRRFIVGLPTNSLNKIFMRLYEDVDTSNYLESVEIALLKKGGSQRFPSNTEIRNTLKEKDLYNIKAKNRSYLLEKIENFNNRELVIIEGNPNISVEHIFPQTPKAIWKTLLGEDYKQIQESYLNTIGNLTLSGNNSALGNYSFLEKKNMNKDGKEQGYIYSRLWLNSYLKSIDKWGVKELLKRHQILFDRFIQVWYYPEIKIDTLEFNDDELSIFDADEPTGKKLEYAIFLDQKITHSEITRFYQEVIKILYDLDSDKFHNTDLKLKLKLTANENDCRTPLAIDENKTMFIESNISSKEKFDKLKYVLSIFDFEDELLIKYKK